MTYNAMKTETLKAKELIESSFLAPLLLDPSITDISYNGKEIFFQSSITGRQISTIHITNEVVYQFLKQVANYMNCGFSFSEPILDMSVEQYRIHAIGESITRKMYEKSISFSIRIHTSFNANDLKFLQVNSPWIHLFKVLIQNQTSIVISGVTGVGKTQLQKELLTLMEPMTRVIIIDNILELDGLDFGKIDLTLWQVKDSDHVQVLLKAALRSHPDWLMIAETRGKEFKDVFASVVTGHPLITTLHSKSAEDAHQRMAMMILDGEHLGQEEVIAQVTHFFPCIVHLDKRVDEGKIVRFIHSILLIEGNHHTTLTIDKLSNFLLERGWLNEN
jgi:pilus assembly protein CpaF